MILINAVRGLCMALADSVPGVSGGTVAFLLGFYDRFITALDDFFRGKRQERIAAFKFLIQLGVGWLAGMSLAVIVLTKVFETHIYAISSLFIGFILFAIPLVMHEEKETIRGKWKWLVYLVLGIVFVILVSSFHPAAGIGTGQNPAALAYVFLGGIVGISAMVLPGISGSTLLLVMGLYLPVITAVRTLLGLDFSALPVLTAFVLGVLCGIILFIRMLRFLMTRYRAQMVFLIVGLMLGSIYSVILGPTTLDVPKEAMTFATFQPLFFVLGGAVILGLQAMKVWLTRKGIEKD